MSGILLNQGTLHYPSPLQYFPKCIPTVNNGLMARSSDLVAENHGNHISKGCKQTINNIAPYTGGGYYEAHSLVL